MALRHARGGGEFLARHAPAIAAVAHPLAQPHEKWMLSVVSRAALGRRTVELGRQSGIIMRLKTRG